MSACVCSGLFFKPLNPDVHFDFSRVFVCVMTVLLMRRLDQEYSEQPLLESSW